MEDMKATSGGNLSNGAADARDNGTSYLDQGSEKLTLFEKKALLVNMELDAHGMGKYQWVRTVNAQTPWSYSSVYFHFLLSSAYPFVTRIVSHRGIC